MSDPGKMGRSLSVSSPIEEIDCAENGTHPDERSTVSGRLADLREHEASIGWEPEMDGTRNHRWNGDEEDHHPTLSSGTRVGAG